MKPMLIAALLAFACSAAAAPTLQDQIKAKTAKPATTAAPAPAAPKEVPAAVKPGANLPPECVERLRAHAEKMKKELGLSDVQAAAMRDELQRYHGQMMSARDGHRDAVAKILTPEQNAKLEGHHAERRQKMMERCAADDEDGDHDQGKHKGKEKH